MSLDNAKTRLLVTGATGLVGSHVAEKARQQGIAVRALVRQGSDASLLERWGVEIIRGSLTEEAAILKAANDVTHIVHCAAKLGDWGSIPPYREVNVGGTESLLKAVAGKDHFQRFVHISSMAVYEARDHFGTDETEPVNPDGVDAYAVTKVEAEQTVLRYVQEHRLPAIILRPGWIYGPRDRTVLPRILERLEDGKFAFLGSGEQLMNNVYVGNLVDAIFLALESTEGQGEAFNIADARLVTKHEFFETIAQHAGFPKPTRHIAMPVARLLARLMEGTWRLLGKQEAPLLSQARIKLLGLNLHYDISKARRLLGYDPGLDFQDGMKLTMDWFRETGDVQK